MINTLFHFWHKEFLLRLHTLQRTSISETHAESNKDTEGPYVIGFSTGIDIGMIYHVFP